MLVEYFYDIDWLRMHFFHRDWLDIDNFNYSDEDDLRNIYSQLDDFRLARDSWGGILSKLRYSLMEVLKVVAYNNKTDGYQLFPGEKDYGGLDFVPNYKELPQFIMREKYFLYIDRLRMNASNSAGLKMMNDADLSKANTFYKYIDDFRRAQGSWEEILSTLRYSLIEIIKLYQFSKQHGLKLSSSDKDFRHESKNDYWETTVLRGLEKDSKLLPYLNQLGNKATQILFDNKGSWWEHTLVHALKNDAAFVKRLITLGKNADFELGRHLPNVQLRDEVSIEEDSLLDDDPFLGGLLDDDPILDGLAEEPTLNLYQSSLFDDDLLLEETITVENDADRVKRLFIKLKDTNITHLNLSGNKINKFGGMYIANTVPVTNLTWLNIDNMDDIMFQEEISAAINKNIDKLDPLTLLMRKALQTNKVVQKKSNAINKSPQRGQPDRIINSDDYPNTLVGDEIAPNLLFASTKSKQSPTTTPDKHAPLTPRNREATRLGSRSR